PERDSGRSRRSDRRRDRGDSASASGGTNTTTNASANGTDFASFQIIADRNIFNANRSARSARVDRDPPPKQVRVDTLALVGSMSYTKGDFAFFDGSSSEFRRVLKAGDTVAGFQVQTIGRESVQLQSEGKTLELSIGSHLRREDGGEWRLVAESAPASSFAGGGSGRERRSDSSSSSTPGDSSTSSTSAGSGDADDILQRLMKKREQEMK
ncbi:MAG: hypothetical protein JNL97_07280, partial [Verrucomicrobiales bacterium]|nr:hypothetical protein [Verrucomicrobiales bacterium]